MICACIDPLYSPFSNLLSLILKTVYWATDAGLVEQLCWCKCKNRRQLFLLYLGEYQGGRGQWQILSPCAMAFTINKKTLEFKED